jgi:hypothetical protein
VRSVLHMPALAEVAIPLCPRRWWMRRPYLRNSRGPNSRTLVRQPDPPFGGVMSKLFCSGTFTLTRLSLVSKDLVVCR